MIPCNLLWAFRSAHAGQLWTQCVRSFLADGQKYRRDRRCHVLFTLVPNDGGGTVEEAENRWSEREWDYQLSGAWQEGLCGLVPPPPA